MNKIILLDLKMASDGHRAAYAAFLSRLFDLDRMGFGWKALSSKLPVLVPMIEESFGGYFVACLIRSLFGRRTVGFLFRPRPVLEASSARLRLKYFALRFLLLLPKVKTLTILPFSVDPRFSEIADGWIYDPQFWDLDEQQRSAFRNVSNELADKIQVMAAGRRVCCALGRQDRSKGFDWFARLFSQNSELRKSMLFAFGGKVDAGCVESEASLSSAGGFACNRFISDEELLAFYANANLIWCAYSKDYDQASGILGRAVQLGIPAVVRKGSLIQKLCELEGFAHVAIDDTADGSTLITSLPRTSTEDVNSRVHRMQEISLKTLRNSLGVAI